MSNALLGWNNLALSSPLYALSAALPIENIRDETGSPSVAWQTPAGVVTTSAGALFQVIPAIENQTVRVMGIFRTNLSPSATVYFSLWSRNTDATYTQIWTTSASGPEPGYGQVVAVHPTGLDADLAMVNIDDPGNRQGFINVPLVFVGDVLQLETGPSYATTLGRDHAADERVSRGGQEYVNLRWTRRRWEVDLPGLRPGEVAMIADLDRVSRAGANVLFIPDWTDDDAVPITTIYGRLTSTADVGFPYGAADRRSWRARITERL